MERQSRTHQAFKRVSRMILAQRKNRIFITLPNCSIPIFFNAVIWYVNFRKISNVIVIEETTYIGNFWRHITFYYNCFQISFFPAPKEIIWYTLPLTT